MIEEFKQLTAPPPEQQSAGPQSSEQDDPFEAERWKAVARRFGFVAGMTLVCYGLGATFSRGDAPSFMGWGGFLLGWTIPLGRK